MIQEIFNIDYNLITIGSFHLSVIELFSVITGLFCVFLAGRNNKYNFWIGYVYCIFLFLLLAQKHLYSAMLLQPIAFIINILGHWRWTHPKQGEESKKDAKELKITSLSLNKIIRYGIIVAILGVLWGIVLKNLGTYWAKDIFTPDPRPFFDAFLLIVTLLALYLSAQKKLECWYVWIAVNIINIIIYISAGLKFMPIVSCLYLLNAIWALITWTKLYKKEN